MTGRASSRAGIIFVVFIRGGGRDAIKIRMALLGNYGVQTGGGRKMSGLSLR